MVCNTLAQHPNDIIRALKEISFGKYIIFEDFHYLPTETQEAFSVALKAFHEQSEHTFVIVGVWLDENHNSTAGLRGFEDRPRMAHVVVTRSDR